MFTFIGQTLTEVISHQIAEHSNTGKPLREFLSTVISEFESSEFRKNMDVAWRYYNNENDINKAKRMVIGRDPTTGQPVLVESKVLANNKLNHNFLRKLTRQKIGYMLGKPFTLARTKSAPDDERADRFFEKTRKYMGMNFFSMIKNVARDSIVKGMGWIMVYYNEEGELKFKRVNPEEVIPLWADSDHTVLDAAIRKYTIEQYQGGKKKLLKFVDYYTLEGVYHFQYNDNGELVEAEEPYTSNFYVTRLNEATGETERVGVNWTKIPLIPFKYDPDEQNLLSRIKTLIDDYDSKTSGVANSIDDFPNSITVVKNYDGASKEEFVHNKNQYRTIFVQGDGDAKSLETKLNIEEIDKHLERLRQDIYEFGQGVNTANKDIRDTSGVALRFLYADLDMDCMDWGSELQRSLMNLFWFIQQDIMAKEGEDFTDVEYEIVFNRDVIINESETIQNCFTSKGIISDETIAANHPWTLNPRKEVEELYKTTEETLALEAEYGKKVSNPAEGQRSAKQ